MGRPTVARPGTIRGDFALSNRENLVHGSDSAESAKREIALWFPDLVHEPEPVEGRFDELGAHIRMIRLGWS